MELAKQLVLEIQKETEETMKIFKNYNSRSSLTLIFRRKNFSALLLVQQKVSFLMRNENIELSTKNYFKRKKVNLMKSC